MNPILALALSSSAVTFIVIFTAIEVSGRFIARRITPSSSAAAVLPGKPAGAGVTDSFRRGAGETSVGTR